MSDQGAGNEMAVVGVRIEDDPTKAGLVELEREFKKVGEAAKKAADDSAKGSRTAADAVKKHKEELGGAEGNARKLATETGRVSHETSALSGLATKAAGAMAALFSVQQVAQWIAKVQQAQDALGKMGAAGEVGTAQSALGVGLSARNQNSLRSIQRSVNTGFDQAATKSITDAVLNAVAPQTEAEGRRAVDATRIALGSFRAVGGDVGKATEIATAAGNMLRQESGLSPSQAFDLATRASEMQGGKDALAGFERNYAVMRNILPDATPLARAQEGIALSTLFAQGGLGAETGGAVLSKLAIAQGKVRAGDLSDFATKDPVTGKTVTNVPAAMYAANPIAALEGLLGATAAGDQASGAAADRLLGEKARQIAGAYATGDLAGLRASIGSSGGALDARAGRIVPGSTADLSLRAQEDKRAVEYADAERNAARVAKNEAAAAELSRLQEEAGVGPFRRAATSAIMGARGFLRGIVGGDADNQSLVEGYKKQQTAAAEAADYGERSFPPEAMNALNQIAANTSRTQTVVVAPSGEQVQPQEF